MIRLPSESPGGAGATGAAVTATNRRTPVFSSARRMAAPVEDATRTCRGPRGPMPDTTASAPSTTGNSASTTVRSGTLATSTPSGGSATPERTTAVTSWPALAACRTISPPICPVAPKTVILIVPPLGRTVIRRPYDTESI